MSKFFVIKRHALRLFLSLSILLFFLLHTTGTFEWSFINTLEHQAYDARLKYAMPNSVDDRIVIVDIDEKSLSEIGRWPWNRAIIALIIDQLFDTYQINVLGMDAVFAEPDESSGLKKLQALAAGPLKNAPVFLETLKSLEKKLDYDGLLAESLQNRRVVLGYAFTSGIDGINEAGQLPKPIFTKSDVQSYDLNYVQGNGFAANLPKLQAAALTAGHFNHLPDIDGIVRRVPILYGYKGQLYESLSLAMARAALEIPHVELQLDLKEGQKMGVESLLIGQQEIPVDENLQTLIPYRGKWGSFPYVSATDVLHGRISDPNLLTDKIVLFGTTAQGLRDIRATPMENVYPGVEIHANIISGLLDNRMMSYLPFEEELEVFLLIFISVVMISLLPLSGPLIATVVTLVLSVLVIWMNLFLWNQHLVVFPIATILLFILTEFVFNMSYGYFVESSHKHYLTSLFGQYVPPELVDEMSKNIGHEFSMEGENREMTVLFSDVRGFTTLSEGLEPKELSQLMNEYLTPMTHIIHEYRGTIDKYMGDAIMAFWGAPLHDSQHARHALDAAISMVKRLEDLRVQFKAKGWPQIRAGIGLNTGTMSVGNMGSQFRMAYTVLGDAVNLGSRLEGLTKQYGVQIIVNETTKEAVPEYRYRELDRVKVKGKDNPVAIYEPMGLHQETTPEVIAELAEYEQALKNYRQQRWKIAQQKFSVLCQKHPATKLYPLYAARVEHFIANPPDNNWDGVYTFTTK
jgi:adenylate cyclase